VNEKSPGAVEPTSQVHVDEPIFEAVRDRHSICVSRVGFKCIDSEMQHPNLPRAQFVQVDSEQPVLGFFEPKMADAAVEVGQSLLACAQQVGMTLASETPEDVMMSTSGLTAVKKPVQGGNSDEAPNKANSPCLTNKTVNKQALAPSSPAVAPTKKTDVIFSSPVENTPDHAKTCDSAGKIETRPGGVIVPVAGRPGTESCCLQLLRLSCDEDSSALLSDCSDPLDQLGQAITSSGGSDQQQTVCFSVAFILLV
jgi:hypothetical protein